VKLTKLGARRLLRLAKILDTADALHRKRGEPTYDQTREVNLDCETPACAWGHYAFSSKALHKKYVLAKGSLAWVNYHDAKREFNLDDCDHVDIFGFNGCNRARTAKQAAKYIRSFVKRKGVE
jgi:nitrate reductase alpha subunit